MTKEEPRIVEETGISQKVLGREVSEKVADLLCEIEKEPVPDRLMSLALELQKALNEKLK